MEHQKTTPKTHAEALAWYAALAEKKPIRWPPRHRNKQDCGEALLRELIEEEAIRDN